MSILTSKHYIWALIVFLSVLLGIVLPTAFYSKYAKESAVDMVRNFERQYAKEINNGDLISITDRLNNLSASLNWVCIKAKKNDEVFYFRERGICSNGLFQKNMTIVNESSGIFFEFVLKLPQALERLLWIFIIISTVLTFMVLFLTSALLKAGYRTKMQIKDVMFNSQLILSQKMNLLSAQVAHDIRSPLAALNMVIKDIDNVPEEKRLILRNATQRIQDIANNLLTQRKADKGDVTDLRVEMISTPVEEIVSEKRFNYRTKLGINITASLDKAYGLFTYINLVEFKRMLSNLINNSVEAMDDSTGEILVEVSEENNKIQVVVSDNGKGIPDELIDKVTEVNFSYGKEKHELSGSGLGLYHAKNTIEKWGGTLEISSKDGVGTKVTILMDKSTVPNWFLDKLRIDENDTILILDDDPGIHQSWEQKLSGIKNKKEHFSTPEEVRKWISSNYKKNIICLFDYEIVKHHDTGLSLIEELGIGARAVLVTSYYNEKEIQERVQKQGAKILPKLNVGLVPIELIKDGEYVFDAVYVEDDELLRMGWESLARKKGIKLLTLPSAEEFTNYVHQISKENTYIYLDRDLGLGKIKGDEFSKKLHREGYKNLFLVSGSDFDDQTKLPHLIYLDKKCPWED